MSTARRGHHISSPEMVAARREGRVSNLTGQAEDHPVQETGRGGGQQ